MVVLVVEVRQSDTDLLRSEFMSRDGGAQIGTAYLFTPEATISALHREALACAGSSYSALTNLFSGRPARGQVNRLMRELGPMSAAAPPFPTAGEALAPLKAASEGQAKSDFTSLWSGQAAALGESTDDSIATETAWQDRQRFPHHFPRDSSSSRTMIPSLFASSFSKYSLGRSSL